MSASRDCIYNLDPKLRRNSGRRAARGLPLDAFAEALVEGELVSEPSVPSSIASSSGMVEENGLRVYRTGNPLPTVFIDDAIRRSRKERSLHLLGHRL